MNGHVFYAGNTCKLLRVDPHRMSTFKVFRVGGLDLSAHFHKQNGQGQRRGADLKIMHPGNANSTQEGGQSNMSCILNANPSLSALRKGDTTYDVCTEGTGGQEMPKFA